MGNTTKEPQKLKDTKFALNDNKAIATNVAMDENIHLVLFNEILMLASEHFARFDCDCAPVVFMVIQTPSSLLPREKLPTSVGSVENSARIICSHSWI